MVLSLLYQLKAVRLAVVILMVLVRGRKNEQNTLFRPSFFCPQVRRWHLQQTLPKVPLVGDNFHFINAIAQLMIVNFVHIMSFLQHCNKLIA